MQKEYELAATERMGAEQNRRMKWLRATRIGCTLRWCAASH